MTPQQELVAAADWLLLNDWCQGPSASRFEGCALTAAERANSLPFSRHALALLVHVIGKTEITVTPVIDWNDAPGRTKAEVITALRAAAKLP